MQLFVIYELIPLLITNSAFHLWNFPIRMTQRNEGFHISKWSRKDYMIENINQMMICKIHNIKLLHFKKNKRTIMAMFSSPLEIYCLVLGCQWCSIDWRQSDRNTALETNYLANFMPSAYISSDLCDCMQRTISFRVNLYLM